MSRWQDKPCKLWIGSKINGYGKTSKYGKMKLKHRLEWEEQIGPIPINVYVCHHCDIKACYEITHLFLGSNSDNQQDAKKKGRLLGRGSSKLSVEQVKEIRMLHKANEFYQYELAKMFKVSDATISLIVNNLEWKDV